MQCETIWKLNLNAGYFNFHLAWIDHLFYNLMELRLISYVAVQSLFPPPRDDNTTIQDLGPMI